MNEVEIDVDALEALRGETVAGRYVVESIVGVGGMAAVLRALRLETGERVALKILLPGDKDEGFARRFVREARVASRLRHPNVARVQEVGRWGDGRLFIAMELIEGCALFDLLDVEMSVGTLCSLLVQVLDALAFVHARGILHRDIKPENVLVAKRPDGRLQVKLVDFGIAANVEDDGERLTKEGMLIGTPDYMAPEQVQHQGFIGPPVDLYAVGIILFRMLAGREPFDGTPIQRLTARVTQEPPPLTARAGLSIPEGLAEVVKRFMARKVVDRYASAAEGRAALLPFCEPPTLDDAAWVEASGDRISTLPPEPTQMAGPEGGLWGREAELAKLEAHAVQAQHNACVVLVKGELGMGKSALVSHFALTAAESGRFSVLRAAYQRAAGAEVGVRGAIERMLGTAGRGRISVEKAVRAFLEQQGLSSPDEVAALVGFLRPAVGERLRRNESFARVVRLLRAMARRRPVLLVLDDLPSGGPDAMAFVEHLLFEASYEPLPLLVLATLRPSTTKEGITADLDRLGRYQGGLLHQLSLGALDAEVLASALQANYELTAEAARRVVTRSGGNPLFAVHLAQADHLPHSTGHGMTGPFTSKTESLPDALRSILHQSLRERLAAMRDLREAEDVLVQIAVLGELVAVELIEAMTGATMSELDELLDELIEHELLVEAELETVSFAHGLFREALLAKVSPRRMRRLHLAAAETRQRFAGADAAAGAIGDHYAAASKAPEAIGFWLRGMAYEAAAGDASAGSRCGLAALGAMEAADERQGETRLMAGRLLRDLGEMASAADVLAPLVGGSSVALGLRGGELLAEIHQELGEGEAWSELLATMKDKHAEAAGEDHGAYHRALAFRLNHQGDAQGAREAATTALEVSEPGPDALRAATRLAWACKFIGDLEGARVAADRAAEEAGQIPELRAEALRMQLFTRVPTTEAGGGTVRLAREALELQRRSGRAAKVVRGMCDVATAELLVGEQRKALELFADAEDLAARAGMRQVLGYIRLFTFVAQLELNEAAGLADEVELTRTRFVEVGSTGFVPLLELCAAVASASDGDVPRALEALERAGDLRQAPFSNEFARLMARLGHLLVAAPEPDPRAASRAVLEAADGFLRERELVTEADACREALAGLG